MGKKILVVDDEKDIADLLDYNLKREGFETFVAHDGRTALELARKIKPELMILDLMLPEIDGLEVCRLLKRDPRTENIPIIMLTAKAEITDRVVGLEIGADDYVTKPFHVREFLARVKALLRRIGGRRPATGESVISVGNLKVDGIACTIVANGKTIQPGAREFKLLQFLAQHPGRVFSRNHLLDKVWGDEVFVEPRTVDVHISRLRAMIEPDRDNPSYIMTVRGLGYKFVAPDQSKE